MKNKIFLSVCTQWSFFDSKSNIPLDNSWDLGFFTCSILSMSWELSPFDKDVWRWFVILHNRVPVKPGFLSMFSLISSKIQVMIKLWNSKSDSQRPTIHCLLPDVFSLPTARCIFTAYFSLLVKFALLPYFSMHAAYFQLYCNVYCLLFDSVKIVYNYKTKLNSIF